MNELRRKRKDLEITQLQAANACGVSLRTYQTYEETHNFNTTYKVPSSGAYSEKTVTVKSGETTVTDDGYDNNTAISCDLTTKYYNPEIKCAYLYGSYARGEATGKSDIDIIIVLDKPMGLKFFGIASDLEELLHKEVDLHSYEQLVDNAPMIKDILVEGIKIYG